MPTLDWIGKQAVVDHHREVPYHLLRCDPALSVGEAGEGNLLLEGDNLLALKALLPYYAGKVKLVYIDPPYNTGNEKWAYNDNVNSPEIRRWLHKTVGAEAEDLSRHDKWLCMMYPRLVLLKKLVREDGAIFVSIDDNEVGHLRSLMDEVFGHARFIACNVWQKRYSRENREAIGDVHEYVVVYAMNPDDFARTRNRIPLTEKQAKIYKNRNKDPKGRWRAIPITAQEGHATPDQFYEIVTPSGRVMKPPAGRCWSLSKQTFEKLRAEGRTYFGKKGDSQPNVIRYLSEVEGFVPWTWWPHDEVGHTDEAKKELYSVFDKGHPFENPKPTRLLRRVIQIASNPGDLILDSFAGSGTTGHAVLQQNAEDGGNRKFILVELEADIARNITAERLKRVIQGYGDKPALGGGFRYCPLGVPLFDEKGEIHEEAVKFLDLARHIFFTETGEPLPQDVTGNTPYIGEANGKGYYLLWNGHRGENGLDGAALKRLPRHPGGRVVFADGCRLSSGRLQREGVIFKQIPYQVKVS